MSGWWEGQLVGFDLETTGPDPETARIVTATIVRHEPGQPNTVQSWLVNPGVDIPEGATAIHGITTERAHADGEDPEGAIAQIVSILAKAQAQGVPLVAFNAVYDFTVLARESTRWGRPLFTPTVVIDPHVIDKKVDTYRRGKRTLTATCEVYGVQLENAHSSDADALAAVELARAIAIKVGDAPPAADLHARQIVWRAEQAASLQDYFRRKDPAVVVDGTWPMHPVAAGRLHTAGAA